MACLQNEGQPVKIDWLEFFGCPLEDLVSDLEDYYEEDARRLLRSMHETATDISHGMAELGQECLKSEYWQTECHRRAVETAQQIFTSKTS